MRFITVFIVLLGFAAGAAAEDVSAPRGVDLVFVVEGGGRLSQVDPQGLQALAISAVLSKGGEGLRVGLVDAATGRVRVPLTKASAGGAAWVKEQLRRLSPAPSDLPYALIEAARHIASHGRASADKAVWVSTAGGVGRSAFMRWGPSPDMALGEAASALRSADARLYVFASREGPGLDLLADVAASTGGRLQMLAGPDRLADAIAAAGDLLVAASLAQADDASESESVSPSGLAPAPEPPSAVSSEETAEPSVGASVQEVQAAGVPAVDGAPPADSAEERSSFAASGRLLVGVGAGVVASWAALGFLLMKAGHARRKAEAVARQLASNVAGGELPAPGADSPEALIIAELEQRIADLDEKILQLESAARSAASADAPAQVPLQDTIADDGLADGIVDFSDEQAVSAQPVDEQEASAIEDVPSAGPEDAPPVEAAEATDLPEQTSAESEIEVPAEAEEIHPESEPQGQAEADAQPEAEATVEVQAPAEEAASFETAEQSTAADTEEPAGEVDVPADVAAEAPAGAQAAEDAPAQGEAEASGSVEEAVEEDVQSAAGEEVSAGADGPDAQVARAQRDTEDVVELFAEAAEEIADAGVQAAIAEEEEPASVADEAAGMQAEETASADSPDALEQTAQPAAGDEADSGDDVNESDEAERSAKKKTKKKTAKKKTAKKASTRSTGEAKKNASAAATK